MELQRREFLKLVGTAAFVSSAFGVVHVASASQQAVSSSSGERVVPVMCGACGAGCGLLFVERKRGAVPTAEFRTSTARHVWQAGVGASDVEPPASSKEAA